MEHGFFTVFARGPLAVLATLVVLPVQLIQPLMQMDLDSFRSIERGKFGCLPACLLCLFNLLFFASSTGK